MDIEFVRREIALGCRMLASARLTTPLLGQISVRVGDGVVSRCRGPQERGLLFTTVGDIRLAGLDASPAPRGRRYRRPLPAVQQGLADADRLTSDGAAQGPCTRPRKGA